MEKSVPLMKAASNSARAQAARLAAVQGLYEYSQNQRDLKEIVADYLSKPQIVEGEPLIPPDSELYKKILSGAVDRFDELSGMVQANLKQRSDQERVLEPLLKSIIIAGSYELLAHHDIDFPIIINDYVHVAHAFYPPGEAKLVNAVLDAVARQTRS